MADNIGTAGELESPKDAGSGPEGAVRFWRRELDVASREERGWRQDGRRIIDLYRDADNSTTGTNRRYRGQAHDGGTRSRRGPRFNILFSNTETIKPAVYSQLPQPEVRRRYMDQDPVGRETAETLERALSACMDDVEYDLDTVLQRVRDDGLLPGRGVPWIKYEAVFARRTPQTIDNSQIDPLTGDVLVEVPPVYVLDGLPVEPDGFDGDQPFIEEKVSERVFAEHVYWEDLRMSPSRDWEGVWWIARRHVMKRSELVEMFGPKARNIDLNYSVESGQEQQGDVSNTDTAEPRSSLKRAEVWEIWRKDRKQRLWIAEGHDEIIEREDDPLGLENFFPIPEPYTPYYTTDCMVPIPEYTIYEDQASEVDRLTRRIMALVEYLKVTGLYDAVQKEVVELMGADEGQLVPVEIGGDLRSKGGLNGSIWFMPLDTIMGVLTGLYREREEAKQAIYEVIGISDILRGQSAASESATAQRIKSTFGSIRLETRKRRFEKLVRDVLRIKAEIMAEHFDQATLREMTGRQVPDEVMQLLRDERTRTFRIDVETDSTIQPDAEQERRQSIELTAAVSQFLGNAAPIAQAAPETTPLLMEMLKLSFRSFNVGRTFEDTLDRMTIELQQKAQQPQPNPEAEQARAEMQVKQQETQIKAVDAQTKRMDVQGGQAIDAMNAQTNQLKVLMGGSQ